MGMDYKITNYDVSTEQIYLNQTTELPLDIDFTLSDYEGDIKKVLNCEIAPYITNKQISANNLTVEGEAVIKVIYASPSGELFCSEQVAPFKKLFEIEKSFENGYCEVHAIPSIHSCRAVTERKISIRSSVKLEARVTVIEKKEIISDIDSRCFEQLKDEVAATTPLGKTQKTIIIDEEILIPENLPDAKRILRTHAVSSITDCKVIADKTILKGNLKVTIFYCTEENEYIKYSTNIPFNQIVDVTGITEFCDCDAKSLICGLNITSRNSNENESRKFLLVCKLELNVFARCNSSIPVIYDTYSTKFTATPKCNEVKFSALIKNVDEAFLCKKTLPLPKEQDARVIDIWCSSGTATIKYQKNSAIICGNILANLLFEGSDGTPCFIERIIDFEYPINIDKELNTPFCYPEIKIADCDYTVTALGEPEIKLELLIHAAIYDSYSYCVITNLEVDESTPLNNPASLIAYYADRGENVWEIAKSFSAKLNELLNLNHLSEDTVQTPKMLLIPRI